MDTQNYTPDDTLEHRRFESLINSMADGVLSINESFQIIVYNGAALNILDINSIRKGDTVENVIKLTNSNLEPLDIRQIIVNSKTQTISRDYKIIYQDNSVVSIYLSISPVHLGYGKSGEKGYVLIIRDITREKSLEEERDEFISVVSHELRTPAAITEGAVSNALYILEKTQDISRIKDALVMAHKQTLYLEDMINDLSTLSRAERGILDKNIETIDVHDLLAQLHNNYKSQAQDKGLELTIHLDENIVPLRSVRLYVTEIMQNFITNAIKYTETGSVLIHAHTKDDGVEFAVQDTGIGISKGDQARVFEKFFRAEDFRTRQQNGTGLGLHVTRKLAQLANAVIHLESELNKGSTFSIYFPNLTLDKND